MDILEKVIEVSYTQIIAQSLLCVTLGIILAMVIEEFKKQDMKIEIENGYDGFERNVTGNIDLDGNNVYEWELETYDGFTSIYLIDCEVRINLEDEDELHLFNIDEEVGEEIYDEILTYVNDNGYDFIGEEFE